MVRDCRSKGGHSARNVSKPTALAKSRASSAHLLGYRPMVVWGKRPICKSISCQIDRLTTEMGKAPVFTIISFSLFRFFRTLRRWNSALHPFCPVGYGQRCSGRSSPRCGSIHPCKALRASRTALRPTDPSRESDGMLRARLTSVVVDADLDAHFARDAAEAWLSSSYLRASIPRGSRTSCARRSRSQPSCVHTTKSGIT